MRRVLPSTSLAAALIFAPAAGAFAVDTAYPSPSPTTQSKQQEPVSDNRGLWGLLGLLGLGGLLKKPKREVVERERAPRHDGQYDSRRETHGTDTRVAGDDDRRFDRGDGLDRGDDGGATRR